MALLGLLRRGRPHERAGFTLYGAAVAAARAPYFYQDLGVADSLDGRFDMVGLHVFLLIHRLQAMPEPGPALAQAVFDAMFGDMDINLREMGVGDLSVGKRVRAMWEAFHGRSAAYAAALGDPDPSMLPQSLRRNVWRDQPVPEGAADRLAHLVRAQVAALAGQSLPDLQSGRVAFLAPETVAP